MSNLYFTGAVSQVPLAFTGDAGANQIIVTGTVAAAGPAGATGATGATGPQGPAGTNGVTDHTLLTNIGTNTHAQIDTALTTQAALISSNTTAIALKAPLASPALSGTPTTPTASAGTNTTQIASTAFVKTAVDNVVNAAPGALDTLSELATALGNDASFSTTITNSLASKSPALNPTAVKTANYTAVANDFVPVDTTSGAVTVTLPSAPANGTRFGAKIVTLGTGNLVTVTRGGTDVFNKVGGNTSVTLTLNNQAVQYQYYNGIWYGIAGDIGLTALDARYQAALTLTTTGTSGAATLSAGTLNIPQYSGGTGGVTKAQAIAFAVAL